MDNMLIDKFVAKLKEVYMTIGVNGLEAEIMAIKSVRKILKEVTEEQKKLDAERKFYEENDVPAIDPN